MLDVLDETLDALASEQTHLQGRLRVSLPSEIGPQLFGAAAADFACRHPAVDLRCSTSLAGLGRRRGRAKPLNLIGVFAFSCG
ncbi:hypothetical protein DIE19_36000 [Burkholderia sp. Bp9126]|nr:hypothetical protein DIE19_36000 [Burkholderia sp. Bp9126]